MKALGFIGFRVDDRMIHGIVATQWVPNLKATRAMVIDDEASTNDIMRSSMKMATPAGVALFGNMSNSFSILFGRLSTYSGILLFEKIKKVQ